MNPPVPIVVDPSSARRRSWRRFAGITAFYALVGPLAGALAVTLLSVAISVAQAAAKGDLDDMDRLIWGGLIVGFLVSSIIAYTFGLASAIGVGVAAAIGARRDGAPSWRAVFSAAFVFWLGTTVAAALTTPSPGLAEWAGALFVGHLAGAAICTAATRGMSAGARPARPPEDQG